MFILPSQEKKKNSFRNEHNYYCCQSDVVINSIKLLESDEGKIPKMCFFSLDYCIGFLFSKVLLLLSLL